ncbi:MAG TPA: hypothetical protein VE987_03810 [Polyangiaceae bacterium]|nr:hypothetical protein [Polyangiaceae bacterium]
MATTNTSPTTNIAAQKATIQAIYRKLVDGIQSELAGVDPFVIANQTISRADLLKRFEDRIAASEASKSARSAWRTAVESERTLAQAVEPLRAGIKRLLQMRFGPKSNKLQDFGFTPAKTPKKTAQAKATGVVKAKATRAARGTKGAVQKKAIKGAVTGVAVTPITATQQPAAGGGGGGPSVPAAGPATPTTAPAAAPSPKPS